MAPLQKLPLPIPRDVAERVKRLELPFNAHGFDPYGIERDELARFFTMLGWAYRHYFRVQCFGVDNVPPRGRAMLVGNHCGGVAFDASMVTASAFFEREPPRLAQGMSEKFLMRIPFTSTWTSRVGQFAGLPEHAERLLRDERLLLVFPEGARGTAKLYPERDSLVRFGTGFMRLALETNTAIIPCGIVGGGEAMPTVANLYKLGQALGVPYIPVTPWLLPLPLPTRFVLTYGEPIRFQGDGKEPDEVIEERVDHVKDRIASLVRHSRRVRDGSPRDDRRELR